MYFVAWKIARGIRVLQDNSIVHSDIKSDNILIDKNGNPRIGDFETIQFLSEDESQCNSKGYTPRWAPPELL